MYRQYNQFRNRQFNGNRYGGNRGSGGKRIRSFDPTNLINTSVVVRDTDTTIITHSFDDFSVSNKMKENIKFKGYTIPTPIQDKAIEPIFQGQDLIGIANTGTGKTGAFLIPLIDKASKNRNQKVLIVAPTRELAAQIRDECYSLSKDLNVYCALCIGGANMRNQINNLYRNPQFVVGTPGRLEDLIRSKHLNLSQFTTVVLDEADHIVDIGFIQNIRFIISLLPKNRQSLFFCATINSKVKEIIRSFVTNPITIAVRTSETAQNVQQNVIRVGNAPKIDKLHDLLIQKDFDKILVFGRTKYGVQRLSDELVKRGFKADAIHGNKRQSQRLRTLDKFKSNEIKILIATDVASRGLDIPNVSHVINYDLPESYETYIHRIGRTGRADKTGIALTFVN